MKIRDREKKTVDRVVVRRSSTKKLDDSFFNDEEEEEENHITLRKLISKQTMYEIYWLVILIKGWLKIYWN